MSYYYVELTMVFFVIVIKLKCTTTWLGILYSNTHNLQANLRKLNFTNNNTLYQYQLAYSQVLLQHTQLTGSIKDSYFGIFLNGSIFLVHPPIIKIIISMTQIWNWNQTIQIRYWKIIYKIQVNFSITYPDSLVSNLSHWYYYVL